MKENQSKTQLTLKERLAKGEVEYREFQKSLQATPELQAMYHEESRKLDLWLQLVEARQKSGLTQAEMAKRLGVSQAQVARIEKAGYDSYTLNTLRKYVEALGSDYVLEVRIHKPRPSRRHSTPQLTVSP